MISVVVPIFCIVGSTVEKILHVQLTFVQYIPIFRVSLDLSQPTAARINNELTHPELCMFIYLFIYLFIDDFSNIFFKNWKLRYTFIQNT